MGIRLPGVVHAKQIFLRRSSWVIPRDVPKGYFGVYVGDESQKKRLICDSNLVLEHSRTPTFANWSS